jgi:hypothetical protein
MTEGCNGRLGYKLTPYYEEQHVEWMDEYSSCTCHCGHPPCSSCTHDGHPLCLEETEEAWVRDYLLLVPTDDML